MLLSLLKHQRSVTMNDNELISPSPNVLLLCRLCATETISQDQLINIFDSNGLALDIKSKIFNCLGFDVNENDHLPKIVCTECADNLEKFNEFKIKSNKTTLYLLDLIKKQLPKVDESDSYTTPIEEVNFISPGFKSHLLPIKIEGESSTQQLYIPAQPLVFQSLPSNEVPCNVRNTSFNDRNDVYPSCSEMITNEISNEHKSINKAEWTLQCSAKKRKKAKKKLTMHKETKKINVPQEYICDLCQKIFNTRRQIVGHLRTHRPNEVDCNICNKTFKNKLSFEIHLKMHNKEFNYMCSYCGKGFITRVPFESHIRMKHTKEFPFECNQCDKKYANKYQLKVHQAIHNEMYNFICEFCNKSFKTKFYLNGHKRSHIPKEARKKFNCILCDAFFLTKVGLQRHMSGHTGELNFGCDQCEKCYRDKSSLQNHMLTHTGVKNNICEFCGKAFAMKDTLKDHRRIHTGERPFKCDACQKTFNQRSALNRHKKTCSKVKN